MEPLPKKPSVAIPLGVKKSHLKLPDVAFAFAASGLGPNSVNPYFVV